MDSTDFRGIIGAGLTAADKPRRHMAKGGHARATKPSGKPHHLTVIIAAPPPPPPAAPGMHPAAPTIIGALAHAMILQHLRKMQGRR